MSRRTRLGSGSFRGCRAARDHRDRSQRQEMPQHVRRFDPSPRPAVPGDRNVSMAQPHGRSPTRSWMRAPRPPPCRSGAPHAGPVRHLLLTFFPTLYAGERFHSARVAEPGRRAGLRIRCPKGRGGSTPPSRTHLTYRTKEIHDAVAIASPSHSRGGTRVGPRARGTASGRGLRAPGNDRRGRLVGQGSPWPSHLVGGTRPRCLERVAERRAGSRPAGAPRSRPERRER